MRSMEPKSIVVKNLSYATRNIVFWFWDVSVRDIGLQISQKVGNVFDLYVRLFIKRLKKYISR